MENIKNLLISENENTIEQLRIDPLVLWVDWKDYDEDIVNQCEDIIKTGELKAESRNADNVRGFDIVITYKNKETIVPYESNSNRDTTIITLNKLLNPEFELRFCDWSFGGDTLAFIPMLSSSWANLEDEFGIEKVRNLFSIIDDNKKMFN